MKSLFSRITKKALSLMLVIIVLIGCSSQILAAYTDNIKVGDTLKFTGTSWAVYKTEYSARTLDSSNVKKYLNKNKTITVEFKSGNVLKIGENEYIYYGSTASKYFSKVSSANTSTSSTNTSTNNSNINSTNTTNTKPIENNNQNNSTSNISNLRERTRKRLSFLKSLLNLFSKNESDTKTNITTPSISSITIPSEAGPGYKFHYNNLSDKEKKTYRYIYSKKSDLINAIQINLEPLSNTLDGLTPDEFFKSMKALELDHPEFYYITSQNKYSLSYNPATKNVTRLNFTSKNSSLKQNFDKIDSIANTLISDVKNKSDYEKLKYLHDWIVKNLTYKTNVSLSLDGFITKQGQCMTYALMYKYLLNKLNIDCVYVSGYVKNEGNHAWNQVKLNGKWYGVDVCWDDPTGANLRYTYFLKGKNTFKNRTLDYSYPSLSNSNY